MLKNLKCLMEIRSLINNVFSDSDPLLIALIIISSISSCLHEQVTSNCLVVGYAPRLVRLGNAL